jgi:hypothetical protein
VGLIWNFLVKEKSWSVRLVDGYVQNNQITSEQCKGCDCVTKLVVGNNGDNNLVLYGCDGHKCKHTLIRMNFGSLSHAEEIPFATIENLAAPEVRTKN